MAAPPRITQVTLWAGTVFRLVAGGRLSPPRVLAEDTEVEVHRLALQPGEVSVYSTTLVVDYLDEVRDR